MLSSLPEDTLAETAKIAEPPGPSELTQKPHSVITMKEGGRWGGGDGVRKAVDEEEETELVQIREGGGGERGGITASVRGKL